MSRADAKKLHALVRRLLLDAKAHDASVHADSDAQKHESGPHERVHLSFDQAIESSDRFDGAVHELVLGVLMHHTTLAAAQASLRKLRSAFVDLNELRTASAHDIAAATGERPSDLRDERALRVQAVLRDLFEREGDLSLAGVRGRKSAEQREAMLSLDGVTPFAAMRVLGLHCGQLVVAIDDRTLRALQDLGVVSGKASEAQVAQQMGTLCKQLEPELGIGHWHRLFREFGERCGVPSHGADKGKEKPALKGAALKNPALSKVARVTKGKASVVTQRTENAKQGKMPRQRAVQSEKVSDKQSAERANKAPRSR